MALEFPLALEEFFGDLPIESAVFDLRDTRSMTMTRGGEARVAEIGPALWYGSIGIHRRHHWRMREISARLNLLKRSGGSLLIHPQPLWAPRLDPDGAILGPAVPVIHTLHANNRELRIGGLPAGYTLSQGDLFGFAYGTGPVRHALHEVVSASVVAAPGGITPLFEVGPPIRPGAVTGAAVTLIRPVIKAIAIPDSLRPGTARLDKTEGLAFDFIQTFL